MNEKVQKSEIVALPPIPAKRYFTIGEASDLCGVKPHVLRYWEHEFTQLKPVKRRGNRRYYQHHEVLLIRHIRELLYEQGYTIIGARNKLNERVQVATPIAPTISVDPVEPPAPVEEEVTQPAPKPIHLSSPINIGQIRRELNEVLSLLTIID